MLKFVKLIMSCSIAALLGSCVSKVNSIEFASDINIGMHTYGVIVSNTVMKKKIDDQERFDRETSYQMWKIHFCKKYNKKVWNDYCENVIRMHGKTDDEGLNKMLLEFYEGP